MAALTLAALAGLALAQLSPEIGGDRGRWEAFLKTARIVGGEQLSGPDAVMTPWKLGLEKDGTARFGLWKDIDNLEEGNRGSWRFEIAAYRMDVLLGVEMIPPTVERRYEGRKGSFQLWLDDMESLKARTRAGRSVPPDQMEAWNRAAFLQRAFDSLIGDEDRNANNVLIGQDGRMVLVDHARSFRATGDFSERLMFGANGRQRAPDGGPYLFWPLPRAFVDRVRSLDAAAVRKAVSPYLTAGEIKAVLARRALLLEELDAAVAATGEGKVLY
jgi:hypothetical protein